LTGGAIGLLFFFHFSGYLWGNLIVGGLPVIYLLLNTHYRPRPCWDTATFYSLFRVGFVVMLIDLAAMLFDSADRLVILSVFGMTSFGHYSLGVRLGRLLIVAFASIGSVLYPRMTEQYGRIRDPSSLRPFIAVPASLMSLTLPVLFGIFILTTPGVIRLILPAYEPVIAAAQIYTYGMFFYTVVGLTGYVLITLDRQVIYLMVLVLSAGVNLTMSWLFATIGWNLVGVALGSALSKIFFSIVMVVTSMRLTHEKTKEALRLVTWHILRPAFFVASVVYIIELLIPVGNSWREVSIMWLIRMGVFILATFWLPVPAIRQLIGKAKAFNSNPAFGDLYRS
jgi:O-antigen/teichoic acid export membrane protein